MDNTHKLVGVFAILIAIFALFVTQPGGKLLGLQTAEPRYPSMQDMDTMRYTPPPSGGAWATPPATPSSPSMPSPNYQAGPSTPQAPASASASPATYPPHATPPPDAPWPVQQPTSSPTTPTSLPTQPLSSQAPSGSQPPSSAQAASWPNPDPLEYGDAPYCYTEHDKECGQKQSSTILYTCADDPISGDLLWIPTLCPISCLPSTIDSQGNTIPARCRDSGQDGEDRNRERREDGLQCPPGVPPGKDFCQGDDLYSCNADGTRLKKKCAGPGCAPAEDSWSLKEKKLVSYPAQCRMCVPGAFESCVDAVYSTRGKQFSVKDKKHCNNRGTAFEVLPCNTQFFPREYIGLETIYSCYEHDLPSTGPNMPSKEGRCGCVDTPDPVAYCIQPFKSQVVYTCQMKDRTNHFDGRWGYCMGPSGVEPSPGGLVLPASP